MNDTGAVPEPHGWPLAAPPADYVIGHVRAVLSDRVLDDARVVVRSGRIAEVGPHPPGSGADVDGGGLLCLPGLVDVHSDGLEKERRPRPTAPLPWDFALASFEGKLRAAGVTTVLHGAAFGDGGTPSNDRSVAEAHALCRTVAAGPTGPVEHRILHRLDVRCPAGLAALRTLLTSPGKPAAGPDAGPALVSHEDHTPGQGQYADRIHYERYVQGVQEITEGQARHRVDQVIVERGNQLATRDESLRWLGELARVGAVRLFGHDPDSPAEIEALSRRGGAVAEFPTTVEAARAAVEHGMPVVMGAPNVLRGGSHSGNVSARELAQLGLVTALASDYLPSGLLAAMFLLVEQRVCTLPAAVRLVTSGAASVVGLTDRGSLTEGLRADLVLLRDAGPWPLVRATLRAESPHAESPHAESR